MSMAKIGNTHRSSAKQVAGALLLAMQEEKDSFVSNNIATAVRVLLAKDREEERAALCSLDNHLQSAEEEALRRLAS